MTSDEAEIRALVARWHAATAAGDTAAVLDLMTEDALFLLPGRGPMTRDEFAQASALPAGAPRPSISMTQDIREILVSGDLAAMWTALRVNVTPPGGAAPIVRDGHTLTVFRRVAGRWLLARDANTFLPK